MIKAGDTVLIDTNVILEAHRVSCWQNLSRRYRFHTVSTVMEETQTGYQRRARPLQIDYFQLKESMSEIYQVSAFDLMSCTLSQPEIMGLDPGERDLLIYASKAGEDCWLLASPDKAAMRVAHAIGWLDRMISLEELLNTVHLRPSLSLANNYSEKWHTQTCLNIRMGLLQ